MMLAALILVASLAMLMFYLQALCDRVLRREFQQPYFRLIARTNGLEFPAVRAALQEDGQGITYEHLRLALACDYRALTYLLRKVEAPRLLGSAFEENLLANYCRLLFLTLGLRHFLGLQVKPAALKLAAVLQYFAGVVGQRVEVLRAGNLAPAA